MSYEYEVNVLTQDIGAEVIGLDLSRPLTSEIANELYDLWLEHLVLVFRRQVLEDEDLVRFSGYFGEPSKLVVDNGKSKELNPYIMLVSDIRENGKPIGTLPDGKMYFHSDAAFFNNPLKATTLYSVSLPSRGGNTIFSNIYKVYESLPSDVKKRLVSREAINSMEYGVTIRDALKIKYELPNRDNTISAVHPIVRTHPETNRPVVYANKMMTETIIGLPEVESNTILDSIFNLIEETKEFQYEHVWDVGDLILWDNRCSQHARTDFPFEEQRLLKRVGINDKSI